MDCINVLRHGLQLLGRYFKCKLEFLPTLNTCFTTSVKTRRSR